MKIIFIIIISFLNLSLIHASSNEIQTCVNYFKGMNLRGTHSFNIICKKSKPILDLAVAQNLEYKSCIKSINRLSPITLQKTYFNDCLNIHYQKIIADPAFTRCSEVLLLTGKTYHLNIVKLCSTPKTKARILKEKFSQCYELLFNYKENNQVINRCLNDQFVDFINRKDFKICLRIRNELNSKEDSIATCSQPSYVKLIVSLDFNVCVEKLKQINIYSNLVDRCTNQKFRKKVLDENFIPCVSSLQAKKIKKPLEICVNQTKAAHINSELFNSCYKKLTKLGSLEILSKCLNKRSASNISSTNFDLCVKDLIKYGKANIDTYCTKKMIKSITRKRNMIRCADELIKFGHTHVLKKCSQAKLQNYLNSSLYLRCKSNYMTLGLNHLIGEVCPHLNAKHFHLNNQKIACILKKKADKAARPMFNPDHSKQESKKILLKMINSCREK